MGVVLMIFGVIAICIGISLALSIVMLGSGINVIINGIILFSIGSLYNKVLQINNK